MLGGETDYRKVIRREFDARAARAPKYSLRDFARDLNLAPSRLSEVLSGKQGLSREKARGLAPLLGLSAKEATLFCDLVESEHARARVSRDSARIRLEKLKIEASFHTVQLDSFAVVSDWYHFALIQLIGLKGFRNEPAWIASRLGIPKAQAKAALERLKRLELVEERDGRLVVRSEYLSTPDGVPSAAIRKFHRQVLERAIAALEEQPVERRNFSTVFLPVDPARVSEASRWIRNFRRRFSAKVDAGGEKSSVYCLAVQFFEITKGEKS